MPSGTTRCSLTYTEVFSAPCSVFMVLSDLGACSPKLLFPLKVAPKPGCTPFCTYRFLQTNPPPPPPGERVKTRFTIWYHRQAIYLNCSQLGYALESPGEFCTLVFVSSPGNSHLLMWGAAWLTGSYSSRGPNGQPRMRTRPQSVLGIVVLGLGWHDTRPRYF